MTHAPTETFHFPEVRVVEASAGSGKTYCLARRYVQLLLNPALRQSPVPLRHILAITFTNKAAFEMKARILLFLKKIALGALATEEADGILGAVGLTPESARPLAGQTMQDLICNYNFFQVQTIDSFINALLSGCAFKIGLSANFKIKRNSLDYLSLSLDRLIEQAAADAGAREVFERFLHQYLFLENKPGWFPKQDMLLLLYALYQQGNTYGEPFVPYPGGGEDLVKKKAHILKLMRALREAVGGQLDGRFVKGLDAFLERYSQGFDVDRVSDYFAREDLPLRKGEEASDEIHRLWDEIRQQLRVLCEHEAYGLFNPYIEVLDRVGREFQRRSQRDDVLFLEQLNKKARALFDEGAVTVEELYYRLATRYHHYLVDEFQDTSVLQWQNLVLMIEEALSTGGSLFYVGDKKQAIYGFRGGEVRLFDRIRRDFAAFNVQPERLGNNYRSQRDIVEFNNQIFSLANIRRFLADKQAFEIEKKKKDIVALSEQEFQVLANVFAASEQSYSAGHDQGYVRVEHVCAENKDERDQLLRGRLLERIAELRRRFALKDIAILTRSNAEIEQYTAWLMEAGLAVESERTLNIKENPTVAGLIALLQFLNSPIDNVAFAAFLQSDLFSRASDLSLEELHGYLFRQRSRVSRDKDFYLYRQFRQDYPRIWDRLFAEFFRNVGLYPLYELMISILDRYGVLSNFPGEQGFVMRLLELIKDQEQDSADIDAFLTSFAAMENDQLFVNVADSDAIRLLTVHKSKGLEFPVVIIPALGMRIHVSSGGGLGQQSFIMDIRADHLQLLRIKDKYLRYSPRLYDIWRQRYLQSFLSELNNLYVALTRASEELHIFIPDKSGNSHNPAQFLIPEEIFEQGQARATAATGPAPAQRLRLAPAQYHDWIGYLREEFLDHRRLAARAAARRGEAAHLLLAALGNVAGQDEDQRLAAARQEVATAFPLLTAAELDGHVDLARRVLADPAARRFFAVTDGMVYLEQELVAAGGRALRVDRMVVRAGEVGILDYKSSREGRDQHEEQVRGYMRIVAEIYPGRTVRGYLLYLDDLGLEEVSGEALS